MSLEERYAHDPDLLAFYRKRLLEPGWAGELSPDELAYIKAELRQSASLRRRWGFRPSAKSCVTFGKATKPKAVKVLSTTLKMA